MPVNVFELATYDSAETQQLPHVRVSGGTKWAAPSCHLLAPSLLPVAQIAPEEEEICSRYRVGVRKEKGPRLG